MIEKLPVSKTDNIVILTGAGISQESGLNTFRDNNGLWENHRVEDVATPEAFANNPDLVYRFYNMRFAALNAHDVQPNAAHKALARLEQEWQGNVLIVTQNVDDLHEKGHSQNIIHMHGELRKARCSSCGHIYERTGDLSANSTCLSCKTTGGQRPHIVWFGEYPLETAEIEYRINQCALFISIGTSGTVYPAAGYVRRAKERAGSHTVELNLEASHNPFFDLSINGKAGAIVPDFVDKLLEN